MLLQPADILLWRPLKPREYLICWILRSPYHHASLVDLTPSPVSLDQNIDFVSEYPVPIDKLLKMGYNFDVLRYIDAGSGEFQKQIVATFDKIRSLHYSYWMALKVPFGRSYLPEHVVPVKYVLNQDNSIKIRFRNYKYFTRQRAYEETHKSLTCSGAVALAYCLNGVDCCRKMKGRRVRHPVLYLPSDFLRFSGFELLGALNQSSNERALLNEKG